MDGALATPFAPQAYRLPLGWPACWVHTRAPLLPRHLAPGAVARTVSCCHPPSRPPASAHIHIMRPLLSLPHMGAA